jgi:phytoene synthase
MMARIMGLSDAALQAAARQGRAMQYINFIRDIAEDNALGRLYLPADEIAAAGLADLSEAQAKAHPEAFAALMRTQIERYDGWQAEATAGFRYIPRRYRIAIRTAVDMYNWTSRCIAADPLIVFSRKVKPKKWRVLLTAAKRCVYA